MGFYKKLEQTKKNKLENHSKEHKKTRTQTVKTTTKNTIEKKSGCFPPVELFFFGVILFLILCFFAKTTFSLYAFYTGSSGHLVCPDMEGLDDQIHPT